MSLKTKTVEEIRALLTAYRVADTAHGAARMVALHGRPLRAAAVLVPIILRENGPTVLFTQRASHLADHAGQVSFPGGSVEKHDTDAADTALRETLEETGLARHHVEVVGHLDTRATISGFIVTPVVGLVTPPFELDPDPFEVEEIFEVPVSDMVHPDAFSKEIVERHGEIYHYDEMRWQNWRIWGTTGSMLKNLMDVIGEREDGENK